MDLYNAMDIQLLGNYRIHENVSVWGFYNEDAKLVEKPSQSSVGGETST